MLYFIGNDYLQEVSGEEDKYLYKVAEKLAKFNIQDCSLTNQNFQQKILTFFETTYPEKTQLTGQEALKKLIIQGSQRAYKEYKYTRVDHNGLFIILMFLYGHHFDTDLFLPALRPIVAEHSSDNYIKNAKEITTQLEGFIQQWGKLKTNVDKV